jgi:large subunit ribosomal protein L17
MKSLADSLVLNESIETTFAKAKDLVPYAEKLITRAKNPTLANRRLIIARLQTIEAGHKLVDQIAPKLKSRTSGHLRVTRTTNRRGDNAQLAKVSFVDDLKVEAKPATTQKKAEAAQKTSKKSATAKKPAAKKPTTAKKEGK